MYLKTLTVRGFKSFASATSFDFEPGITAVVGPNGSGKSNVVDALAWVMGEQGAKTLRGGSMEDVIFAGTSSRAALGRAHVTLTIDNSDGALPIEYSEVTISRTLFRSGGSEYAINGAPVRLLDIQELLSDSGLGREMHVIVGQGQLDRILQATPEERRGFIEEAAGILKHRRRKEKTLRKLEATQANLHRLEDLTQEISKQLKPLGRQAETARRARTVQARLRDAKSRLIAHDVVLLMDEAQSAAQKTQDLEEAQTQAQSAADQAQRAIASSEAAAAAASPQAAAARDTWYKLSHLAERFDSLARVAAERQRLLGQTTHDAPAGEDPDVLERRAEATDQDADAADEVVSEAQESLEQAGQTRAEAEQAQHAENERLTALLRAVADRREGLAKLAGEVGTARQKLESATGERQRAAEARDAALARRDETKAQEAQAQHEAETAQDEAAAPLQDVTRHRESLAEAREALQTARNDLNQANQRQAALEARVAVLTETTPIEQGTGSLLDGHHQSLSGTLSDQLNVQPGYEEAVKAALFGADHGVVASTLETLTHIAEASANGTEGAVTLLHALSTGNPGKAQLPSGVRSVVEVIEAPQEDSTLAALIQALLGSVALAANDAEARQLVTEHGLTAVTEYGHRWSPTGVIIGAGEGAGALARRQSLDTAQQDLQEATHGVETAQAAVDQAQPAVEKAQEALTAAEEGARTASEASRSASARVERLASLIQQAEAEAERHTAAYSTAEQTVEAATASLTELNNRLTVAQDVPEESEPSTAERDRLAEEAVTARNKEVDARLALREAQDKAHRLRERAHSQRRAARTERAARAEAQRKAARRAEQARKASVVAEQAAQARRILETSIATAQGDVEAAEEATRKANADLETARAAGERVTERVAALREQAHQAELGQAERQARYEALEQRALSEVSMTPDHLVEHYGPHLPVPEDFDDQAGQTDPWAELRQEVDEDGNPVTGKPFDRGEQEKRLAAAEKDLAKLGKVNPLALEEFAALEERHTYLNEQLTDLTRSRTELLNLVDEVDQHVRTVFEEAFVDTAEQFTHIFAQLFPGGEGRLTLTEPEDMLTTGIEVEARPAGKKVKRLSLLSGGERSLTALAMLIAIFRARPSPFYVMDEVEAALDERNLLRLLEVFKDLQKSSQLIIITHQKHTMDIADALYGASMRDDGITRVISQRIGGDEDAEVEERWEGC